MKPGGLHLLLTYQCNRECDHCFVWGGPWQKGVMTLGNIGEFLRQAKETGTVREIWFEGGEPFLYYPVMLEGVRLAASSGFRAGLVSNAYWATGREDASAWLKPLSGLLSSLLISCDALHWTEEYGRLAETATAAAGELGIPLGVMALGDGKNGTIPGVMHRGRAAEKLALQAEARPMETFTNCPFENLREPARMHLDPFGNLHVCQGIVAGNLFRKPLKDICIEYDPDSHPVLGPLLAGGPAELARKLRVAPRNGYADACHACYEVRRMSRERFPDILAPGQMYGEAR